MGQLLKMDPLRQKRATLHVVVEGSKESRSPAPRPD